MRSRMVSGAAWALRGARTANAVPPREKTTAPLSTWMSPRTFVSAFRPSVTLTPSFRFSVTEVANSAVT